VLLIKYRISKFHVATFSYVIRKHTSYTHMDCTRRPDYVSMNKNMNMKIEINFIFVL